MCSSDLEKNRTNQRDETDQHTEEKIPAIDELALHAQIENLGLEPKRSGKHGGEI